MGRTRSSLLVAGVVLSMLATVRAAAEGPPVYDEARVKAEFLARFLRFVDWPPSAFLDADDPFVVAALGQGPVVPFLEEFARDQRVKGRRLVVTRVVQPAQVARAHAVWLSADAMDALDAVLRVTAGRPILTVADTPGAAERGVLINLRREGAYLRFDLNLAAVTASGLRFSSKLLRLGTPVDVDPEGPR